MTVSTPAELVEAGFDKLSRRKSYILDIIGNKLLPLVGKLSALV